MAVSEEDIARDRVTISEVAYRRVSKACVDLCSAEDADAMREVVEAELQQYETLLAKWQLEVDMNEQENQNYQKEGENTRGAVQDSLTKTKELEQEYELVKLEMQQKTAQNKFIEDMCKPRRRTVPSEDPGKEKGSTIVVQLNMSRAEEQEAIEHRQREIEELQQKKEMLLQAMQVRCDEFHKLKVSVQDFMDSLRPLEEPDRVRVQDETKDDDAKDDDGKDETEDGEEETDQMDTSAG